MVELTDQARAARRAYYKEWRANNKDKVREKNRRYWEKKAKKEKGDEDAQEYNSNKHEWSAAISEH